jgi:phage tail protein X
LVALVALGELGLDEVAAVAAQELGREAADQLVEQFAVAPDVARLQQRRTDRLVALGIADALVHGAGGMADLQPHVPQEIEHELDDLLAARRLLVGTQEQQIEIGQRGELAAPVPAGRHDTQPLGGARVGGGVGVLLREVEQDADQLVHQERGRRQHGRPVIVELARRALEAAADLGPADGQGFTEQGKHVGARDVAVGPVGDQPGQRLLEHAAPDDGAAVGNGIVGRGHGGGILQGPERVK